jgi:hypothetical protein
MQSRVTNFWIIFVGPIRRSRTDLPLENTDELTSNSDMTSVDSAIDLQRLLAQISANSGRSTITLS